MRREKGTFRRALEISLLLHLLLIFLIMPRVHRAWSSTSAPAFMLNQEPAGDEKPPLDFEFVDLAEEREETPVSDQVPLSDLDRRAHGGEGEADRRPSTVGNTPQLVQAEGGQRLDRAAPSQVPVPPSEQVPPPEEPEDEEDEPEEDQEDSETTVEPEGAGEEKPESTRPKSPLPLPAPGAWQLPPDRGGLPENPDRDGGRVDTGALSFDTQWYDWGPYAKAMLAKIRRHWRIPEIARLGVTGVVKIRYYIEADGTVTGLSIVDESGKPPMDFAARDAIAHSSPFEPLPSDLTGVSREGVTITFYYNMNPPERGRR